MNRRIHLIADPFVVTSNTNSVSGIIWRMPDWTVRGMTFDHLRSVPLNPAGDLSIHYYINGLEY